LFSRRKTLGNAQLLGSNYHPQSREFETLFFVLPDSNIIAMDNLDEG
jgi:hypothetical protein